MEKLFNLENVGYQYNQFQQALVNVSFDIEKGEIFSIIGSNGSGKSTLLHILAGLVFPTSGILRFENHEISEHTLNKRDFNAYFRQNVGYIFQHADAQLFCPTVLDEILFGPQQKLMKKEEAMDIAFSLMKMLNIEYLKDRPTYMLSGGEKKKVAIAAVLAVNPQVLIMDEPTSSLDPKTRSFIIELIFSLNEAGKTIILTSHNLEMISHFQSRVAVLSENHTIERIGMPEDVLNDTEFLVKANLISEHMHKHGAHIHKHLPGSSILHKHNGH